MSGWSCVGREIGREVGCRRRQGREGSKPPTLQSQRPPSPTSIGLLFVSMRPSLCPILEHLAALVCSWGGKRTLDNTSDEAWTKKTAQSKKPNQIGLTRLGLCCGVGPPRFGLRARLYGPRVRGEIDGVSNKQHSRLKCCEHRFFSQQRKSYQKEKSGSSVAEDTNIAPCSFAQEPILFESVALSRGSKGIQRLCSLS